MKKLLKGTGGFTLVEVIVSMLVLALIAAPIGSAFVVSARVNAYADRVFQARLAVSSAAEQLMAEGVEPNGSGGVKNDLIVDADKVDVKAEKTSGVSGLYTVTIISRDINTVKVTMDIHSQQEG